MTSTSLNILSWNLLADAHIRPEWFPNVAPEDLEPIRRRQRIVERVNTLGADLCLFQEVAPEMLAALNRACPAWTWMHAAHRGEGVAIGVRGEVSDWRAVALGKKRALVVTLPTGVRVACVHLSWTGPAGSGERRSLQELEAVLACAPDLVGGDFNALPDWPEAQRMVAAGYRATGAPGPTCNANQQLQRVDEIWMKGGRVVQAHPLPRIEATTGLPGPVCASDHLALVVEIRC